MKISDGVVWTILLTILIVSITAVCITAILTEGSSGDNDPVETRIISHATYGEGYQLMDSVNQRTCVIYPDAPEPGDMLNCYGSAK